MIRLVHSFVTSVVVVRLERPAALRTHFEKTCSSDEVVVLRAWREADRGRGVLEEVVSPLDRAGRMTVGGT